MFSALQSMKHKWEEEERFPVDSIGSEAYLLCSLNSRGVVLESSEGRRLLYGTVVDMGDKSTPALEVMCGQLTEPAGDSVWHVGGDGWKAKKENKASKRTVSLSAVYVQNPGWLLGKVFKWSL